MVTVLKPTQRVARRRRTTFDALDGRQGLTAAEVEHQFRVQSGLCMICHRVMDQPHADHDHALATNHPHDPRVGCRRCFRGLLCRDCNLILGHAHDDPDILGRAAAYLVAAREASR